MLTEQDDGTEGMELNVGFISLRREREREERERERERERETYN